ncbi:hypothetical protein FACS189472_02140 [Alphaproteobacteria bacterium]|nr:hypothetical protein FACS189472_02140 [Alphaproteobacteria bacterium]
MKKIVKKAICSLSMVTVAPSNAAQQYSPVAQSNPAAAVSTKEKLAKELHRASAYGNVKNVETLLENGTDVNSRDNKGRTPLHKAAASGHAEIVKILLAKGADANAKNILDKTPLDEAEDFGREIIVPILLEFRKATEKLHKAAADGNAEDIETLLARGADVNAKDSNGRTPLHKAAASGHLKEAELLLTYGASIFAKNKYDSTPLDEAKDFGRANIVQILQELKNASEELLLSAVDWQPEDIDPLLAKGADVNAKDGKDNTPLHLAAIYGPTEVAELLLDRGADVYAKNNKGNTPLHLAAKSGQTEIARLLLTNGADVNAKGTLDRDNPIRYNGNNSIMPSLEELNLISSRNDTPLHFAAQSGQTEIAELLLARGADVNASGLLDYTPLHLAAYYGEYNIVKLLLDNGADINAKDIYGKEPSGLYDVEKLLKDHVKKIKDKINETNALKRTQLHYAADRGDSKKAKFLLSQGANPNAKDENQKTPLHLAVESGHVRVIKILLDTKGINLNARDLYAKTPLHLAAEKGHTKIVNLLLSQKKVNTKAKDKNKKTPLDLASEKGYGDIVEILKRKTNGGFWKKLFFRK